MKILQYPFVLLLCLFVACAPAETLESPLIKLERDKDHTLYHIDFVNGQAVNTQTPIPIKGEFLEIQGWAVDIKAKNIPGTIYFQVGEKQFENTLITKRQDVVDVLKIKKALNAGYSFKIPTKTIGKGVMETKLIIVKNGNQGYYAPDPSKTFKIEIK